MSQAYSAPRAFHSYRLSVIGAWPESECKRATLAVVRAALQREQVFERATRMGSTPAATGGRVFLTRR